MWLNTARRLRQALRRYRTDKSLETVLHADWRRAPDLQRFFDDIEKRLHGEEITRLQQKQAEYLALQNQINPHFLYNALEAIRSDALLADCTEIAETTEALATFFRYTISNVQEYVTFSDELDNAENYFTIQRCRFGDKLSMELEMENEALLEARMPKLILQPLLENAIFHGINKKPEGRGNIWMRAYREEGWIILEVSDDGVGFRYEREEDSAASSGREEQAGSKYGLANVERRIGLFWKHEASLVVESTPGIGTSVYIRIPCREETV